MFSPQAMWKNTFIKYHRREKKKNASSNRRIIYLPTLRFQVENLMKLFLVMYKVK